MSASATPSLNCSLLFTYLDPAERETLLDPLRDPDADTDLRAGVRDAMAFFLNGLGLPARMAPDRPMTGDTLADEVLVDAIVAVGHRADLTVEDVPLEIEASRTPVSRIAADVAAGEPVSSADLVRLIESDRIDEADAVDAIRGILADE